MRRRSQTRAKRGRSREAPPRPALEAQPEAFGRYRLKGLLGEGSMGRVYRAFDPLAGREVAVKTVRAEHRSTPSAEEYLIRFRREAQAAAGLSHPNIVTVFDVGEDYFVMELLEGKTLEDLVADGPLDPAQALGILAPVASAVDLAHSKGIVHRDLKPANIFLTNDGVAKVMDFGVAQLQAASITAAGTLWGSPAYMAPEQVSEGLCSAASDTFSLGVVTYQALSGQKPFGGDTIADVLYRVVYTDPPALGELLPGLPKACDDVLKKALSKKPGDRYPTARAFVDELSDAAFSGTPVRSQRPATEDPQATAVGEVETHEIQGLRVTRPRPKVWRSAWAMPAAIFGVALATAVAVGVAAFWTSKAAAVEVLSEPAGAEVRIDGSPAGLAPVTKRGLSAGVHTVWVSLAGYAPAEMTLKLEAESLPTPVRLVLQPVAGSLEIRSEPSGATVSVDARPVGSSPLVGFKVPPGRHTVEVDAKGYLPWTQSVTLGAGTELALRAVLSPGTGAPSPGMLSSLGWVRAGDLEQVGPGVTPPRKISGEAASYPLAARKLNVSGTVAVEFTVGETGEPEALSIVQSAGSLLDEQMKAAVRTWRFAPAVKNGVRVRARIRAEQTFQKPR